MRSITFEKLPVYAVGLGIILCSIACTTLLRDHYTPTKWVVTYLIGTIALFFLCLNGFSFEFLRPYRTPLVAVLVSYLVGYFVYPERIYRGQLLDWISFSGLVFLGFINFRRNPRLFPNILIVSVYISTLFILAYGLLQFIGVEPFPQLLHNSFPSSFFGFQNMAAEFMGYSILTQAFVVLYSKKSKGLVCSLYVFLGASILYMVALQCRSVYVALVPAMGILAYFRAPARWRKKALFGVSVFWLALGVAAAIPSLISGNSADEFAKVKERNANLRISRWMNTGRMIADLPLGSGPGTYEFAYLPFHSSWRLDDEVTETVLARSPHNEYLRIAAENGILVAISLFAFWFIFSARLIRTLKTDFSPVVLWVIAVLLFTAIEAVFSFPMDNAFPFLFVSLIVGVGLSLTSDRQDSSTSTKSANLLLFFCFLFCAYLTSAFAYSKYSEANLRNEPESLSTACRMFPSNWRPCMRSVEISIARKRLDEAESKIKEILSASPNNFMALRFF